MRQTLSVGGAILTALFSATGLAFNAFDIYPNIGWKWIALISFVASVVIVWQGWFASEHRAKRYENSKPNLVFDSIHEHELFFRQATQTHKVGDSYGFVSQIWFKNSPQVPTDDSVAKKVTVTVTFYNRDTKEVINAPGCCFIIAEAFDYAGNTGDFLDTIDEWHPNDEPHKLQVAIRPSGSEVVFAFAKPLNDLNRKIEKGKYYAKVQLLGTRVIDRLPDWFALENSGKGSLSLSQIRQPNLRMEGFQI